MHYLVFALCRDWVWPREHAGDHRARLQHVGLGAGPSARVWCVAACLSLWVAVGAREQWLWAVNTLCAQLPCPAHDPLSVPSCQHTTAAAQPSVARPSLGTAPPALSEPLAQSEGLAGMLARPGRSPPPPAHCLNTCLCERLGRSTGWVSHHNSRTSGEETEHS